MAGLVNSQTRTPVKHGQESPGFTYALSVIVSAAVALIGLIVALYALTVSPGIDPEQVLSIFAAP